MEEEAVYRMLQRADSLGVFQVESRAQMSMPAAQAGEILRSRHRGRDRAAGADPGRHGASYLRRRQGLEPVVLPSKELEAVLGKTLGVPLFQEQAMKIAIVAGGFAGRSRQAAPRHGDLQAHRHHRHLQDQDDRGHGGARLSARLRRTASARSKASANTASRKATPRLRAAGLCLGLAQVPLSGRVRSGLLNAQPMGFYAPAQIVRDLREHGVEVRLVDVNRSDWDATWSRGARARCERAEQRACARMASEDARAR